jgi:allophanate hydrolase
MRATQERLSPDVIRTVASIVAAHRSGATSPEQTIAETYARIRAHADPAIFISLRDEADAIAEARALDDATQPLFGVPVAVKDNIDVAGLPTTAACPAYTYAPASDATAVARLRAAGAIVVGKTNLDQFATGLVGVRSPYGIPRNAIKDGLVPGGSSSGSAVAVAAGLVPIALGTDTAGSGRVPAMLNNIVGLKPSLGLVSTFGVVPACRTLDCVSVFALTVEDAVTALGAVAAPDEQDPYSRRFALSAPGACPQHPRLGVPRENQRQFFGDRRAAMAYDTALTRFVEMGATLIEIDVEPLYETARLLYEGPWVAERYLTARALVEKAPEALHPVTLQIVSGGAKPSAADAFEAFYRVQELKRVCERMLAPLDALVVPTAPSTYTIDEVLTDPVTLNSRLGTYTNFVNLLDLCGLAIPASMSADGLPFGVTLLAPAGRDMQLATIGAAFHARSGLTLGASRTPVPPLAAAASGVRPGEIAIAVVGAHLSGMPLNGELRALNGRLLMVTTTAPDYKLFALRGTVPPKPGLVRVERGAGTRITLEVWALTAEGFGKFVSNIPAPMAIGTLRLEDGSEVKGFLVEPAALDGAHDISAFGGWRRYTEQAKATA